MVGVGVLVGATVGVKVDVLFEPTASVEVSSAEPQDTKETPNN